ncbi:hypothetical protein Tco_0389571 [Tanacetum coccineum]
MLRQLAPPIDIEKPLLKDSDGDDVDVHLYRSMIGSLMYLTSSRPDIMFAEINNKRLLDSRVQIDIMAVKEANCGCHLL